MEKDELVKVKKQIKINRYSIFVVLVFGIFFLFGVLSIALPQKKFSENENRYLSKYPMFSIQELLSGSFQSQFFFASNDQFLGRDFWTKTATVVQRSLGRKDVNGIYFGKDGYLFAKKTDSEFNEKRYISNLKFVEQYAKKQIQAEVTTLLVPTPGTILSEKLPGNAVLFDSDFYYKEACSVLNAADFLDLRRSLLKKEKSSQIYYKTDHHWTIAGAYEGYVAYQKKLKRKVKTYQDFQPEKISDKFYGSLYSEAIDPRTKPDTMMAAKNIVTPKSVIGDGKKQEIYQKKWLQKKDKYAYFFGGNYGELTIQTGKHTGKNLLVIKDSFANSMVPFLLDQYDEITMVDLRYFNGSVGALTKKKAPDEILILYELSNFSDDAHFYKLAR